MHISFFSVSISGGVFCGIIILSGYSDIFAYLCLFVWKAAMVILVLLVTLMEGLEKNTGVHLLMQQQKLYFGGAFFPHCASAVDVFRCVHTKLQDTKAF